MHIELIPFLGLLLKLLDGVLEHIGTTFMITQVIKYSLHLEPTSVQMAFLSNQVL